MVIPNRNVWQATLQPLMRHDQIKAFIRLDTGAL
jgi:hypothetical protein